MQIVPINQLIPNNNNPRFIRTEKFEKLVKSLTDFPEMLKIRPIICNKDNIILAGNMRYKAAIEIGLTEIPVEIIDLTPEREAEFLIKDNLNFGEWDFDILANEWDISLLDEWGLDLPLPSIEDEESEMIEKENFDITISCKDELEQNLNYVKLIEQGFNVKKI